MRPLVLDMVCVYTRKDPQKITKRNTHARMHTHAHTHTLLKPSQTHSVFTQTWGVTKHHILPSAACSLTPPPHVTSDLDDNRLSSPSLLQGKHSILQKLADRQNGACVLCPHFNVCDQSSILTSVFGLSFTLFHIKPTSPLVLSTLLFK